MADVITVTSTDGTRIALWRSGAGPALVAVHGAAADHTAWDPVVPLLADSVTVYALDRRGRHQTVPGEFAAVIKEFVRGVAS